MQKIFNGIVIVAILAMGYMVFAPHKSTLGDATVSNYPTWYYNGIVIGPQNTLLTQQTFGTCNLTGSVSLANLATSTVSCAASGALVGDKVFMEQATMASSTPIVAASVTSSGVVSAVIQNLSGGTMTPAGGGITGVQYLILR